MVPQLYLFLFRILQFLRTMADAEDHSGVKWGSGAVPAGDGPCSGNRASVGRSGEHNGKSVFLNEKKR